MALMGLSETGQAVLSLCVVLGVCALFIKQIFSTGVVAIFGVAVVPAPGLLPYTTKADVWTNPAPWRLVTRIAVVGVLTGA